MHISAAVRLAVVTAFQVVCVVMFYAVSVEMDWNQHPGLLKVDGSMVVVGIPDKPTPIAAFSLVLGRRSLAGSATGGIRETGETLDFCGKHNIT